MSNPVLKAAIDGLTESIVNAVVVYKKHEAKFQTIVDMAEKEVADEALRADLGVLMQAGLSGVVSAFKQIKGDIAGDMELLPELVVDSQKILAAFSN